MQSKRPQRRRWWLGLAVAACLSGPRGAVAASLDAPKGAVLLSVGGAGVTRTNDAGSASFDLALLQTLPQTTFSTTTPWYPTPHQFTGVLLRDLLDAVGAGAASSVRAIALNDYRVDMPVDDLVNNGALIAWLLDGETMPVRNKGPIVIIFPFSDRPQLRTAVHYSRAVWQLRRLELR